MADNITLGEFIDTLGISYPTWRNHPEYRDFLAKQDGVVLEARNSSIPASLVETVRAEFNITAGSKRPRKNSNKREKSGIAYNTLSVEELLAHRQQEEALVTDHTDIQAKVKEARETLNALEAQAEASQGASTRLSAINKALEAKTAELEAEADRIAKERKLLAQLAKEEATTK